MRIVLRTEVADLSVSQKNVLRFPHLYLKLPSIEERAAVDHPLELQHTIGHINCPACDALRRSSVMDSEWGDVTLSAIWPYWMEEKSQNVSEKTLKCWREYSRPLMEFFQMPLKNIHIGNIVAYRTHRLTTAGPSLINHEINALSQILARAGLWSQIEKHYKPLRIPKSGPGQALLEEEALWLLRTASTGGRFNRWKVAYFAALLSANTTCGPSELRKLRLKDIDLIEGVIHVVEGAKNDFRVRPLPLNADARWAVQQLMEIATEKGSHLPDHYLFPHRAYVAGGKPDPTKPMDSWKKAWHSLRKEAAKKYPKLATVRFYDLRHHALTTLLENPNISEQTIKDIAGHVSKKILERYSHIRLKRKKAALDALEGLRNTSVKGYNHPEDEYIQ